MLSPSNTNGLDIVCVLDIPPSALRYNNFSILGSFKFLDGIGTLILTEEPVSYTHLTLPTNVAV